MDNVDNSCRNVKIDLTKDIDKINQEIHNIYNDLNHINIRLNTHGLKLDEHIVLVEKFTESINNINKTLNGFIYISYGAIGFFLFSQLGIIETLKIILKL